METKTLGEVLDKVYSKAYADVANVLTEKRRPHAVALEAVAAHVRAEDAARGGTLSAAQMESFGVALHHPGTWSNVRMKEMFAHAAAQGRANAARDACIAELEALADGHEDNAHQAIRERDEARAELAKAAELLDAAGVPTDADEREKGRTGTLPERVEMLANARIIWKQQCMSAESALATLRQAVEDVADGLDGARAYKTPEYVSRKCVGMAADKLRDALRATPSEHPDTATLHKVREWLEQPTEEREPKDAEWWKGYDCAEKEVRALVGDSDPSGGGERVPLNQPLDWSKHATNCTVEFTPGYDTHRTWKCAPDCPSGGGEALCECGKPAACLGAYEGQPEKTYACGDCCGHGNEDGRCEMLEPTTPPGGAVPRSDVDVLNERERECIAAEKGLPTPTPEEAKRRNDFPCSGCAICGGLTCDGSHPTPEEDLRRIEEALVTAESWAENKRSMVMLEEFRDARTALARLKAEPRRAAEAMRERCAAEASRWCGDDGLALARRLRTLPLD